jgi:hypothetical protein
MGPKLEIIVLQPANNSNFMNVLEMFYNYEVKYMNNQLKYKSKLSYIRIFETIVKCKHSNKQHAPSTTSPSRNTQ